MAGKVKESFNLSFKADSIHSGSISFGRFENEPLSWERKSSFSHNRYLEEVEKCSKPGSVIEKKAYFEAHFKKKALFGILPSASHDGSDQTTSENGGSDRLSYQEEVESNEDSNHVQFEQRSLEDFKPNKNGHSVQSAPRSQEDFEQNEDGNDYTINIEKSITLDEAYGNENELNNMLSVSVNDVSITEMDKSHEGTANTDESLGTENMTVTEAAGGVEETTLHDHMNSSSKETMPVPEVNSSANNVQIRKTNSSKSSKDHARSLCRKSPRRANTEKNVSKLAPPSTRSVRRTLKEVSRSEEKVIRESKSEKVSRVKKAPESQPSVLKADSRRIQEAKRVNHTVKSTKSDLRLVTATSNFKSSERAERRKEFYMKLEEKLHAKGVQMNQMEAISQEKTDSEIKKLRKSLDFKATPMPSFYRTALPSQSDGNKAVSNNSRSKKVEKPKCQRSEAEAEAASLSSNLRTGKDQAANKSVASTEQHGISVAKSPTTDACLIDPALPTNQNFLPNSVTHNQSSGKKERVKVTGKRHGVSDSCKGAKRQSDKERQKGEGTPKHSNEIRKMSMRSNNGVKSSSRIGNLPVRVAS